MRKMKKRNGIFRAILFAALMALVLPHAGASFTVYGAQGGGFGEDTAIPGLTWVSSMELTYAEVFQIHEYEGGYKLFDIMDSDRYLLVPEGAEVPSELPSDIKILQAPLQNVYMAASNVMSLFISMDALDVIRLSGTAESGWYLDEAVQAMQSGDILYSGKYSEPDYELLINENCGLAIENTMILHTPKVQEMLEDMGIPVFIDKSSYESHPLGRTEWVRLYGAMFDCQEAADAFFTEESKVIDDLKDFENTGKTVAYFFVDTSGNIVVRNKEDYIPRMIEIAGGKYVLRDMDFQGSSKASVTLSMEDFYANALDSDYLVYNSTIDAPLGSVDELLAKNSLFADFKAVKEGNVWTAGKSLYQASNETGDLIRDFNHMLTDEDESAMLFVHKVN